MAENARFVEECMVGKKRADRTIIGGRVGREQKTVKTKERFDEGDLPSPPPDPWSPMGSQRSGTMTEKIPGSPQLRSPGDGVDIIAYLTSLGRAGYESQTSECPSRNSTAGVSEEAFEHLDRLYGLAEQILDLRGRSTRLFKRVRDLERLKVLRNADREVERAVFNDEDPRSDFPDEDAGFAESLLDAMLSNGRDPQSPRRNSRPPSHRRRTRSLGLPDQVPLVGGAGSRPEGEKQPMRNDAGAPKVSKWTRVKAAFRWERACPSDVTEFAENTVTVPTTPTTRYLRLPETTGSWSGSTLSPTVSEASGPSTPVGRVSSTSSSNEDVRDGNRKNQLNSSQGRIVRNEDDLDRRSRSLDGDMLVDGHVDADHSTNETNGSKPQIRITLEDNNLPAEQSPSPKLKLRGNVRRERDTKRPTPTLTITIPSNEEDFRSTSSPESISPFPSSTLDSGESSPHRSRPPETPSLAEYKRQRSLAEESSSAPRPKMQRQDSKWNKVRRAFLTNATFSVPPSPVRVLARQSFAQDGRGTPKAHSCNGSMEGLEKITSSSGANADTMRDYQALREKLGAEFHRKLIEWERLKSSSNRSAGRNARDTSSSREGLLGEERLAPEFKRKLQEWKRAKKSRRGSASIASDQRVSRRRLTDWQLWRSPSKPETRSHDGGPRGSCGSVGSVGSVGSDNRPPHPCEDFVRRMEAWRRVNEVATRTAEASKRSSPVRQPQCPIDESEFLALGRLIPTISSYADDKERRRNDSSRVDDFLARDASSYADDKTPQRSEVLIRTSVGSYRFEGISREFTRKLYDWEKYRGISPRSSTFRLLGPRYAAFAGAANDEALIADEITAAEEETYLGGLKRSKSVGSIVQTNSTKETFIRRSTSLQSLNRLSDKLEDAEREGTSSAPTRGDEACEDTALDDSEPEAMIVDIEDVIEETASPLARVQPHQTPVYSVAASETTSIAVPLGTVTSSHEPSPVILVEAEENTSRDRREKQRGWNRDTDCSSQDDESVYSDHSARSIDPTGSDRQDFQSQNHRRRSFGRSQTAPEVSFGPPDVEDAKHNFEETNLIEEPMDENRTASCPPRNSSFESAGRKSRASDTTDLPMEREPGNRSEGPRAVDNVDEGTTANDKGSEIVPAVSTSYLLRIRRQLACDDSWDKPDELPADPETDKRAESTDEISPSIIVDSTKNPEETSKSSENTKSPPEIVRVASNAGRSVDIGSRENDSNPLMIGAHQFHGDATTVQTTPLTVSGARGSRSYERIIINEKTLNKIVVPTACSADSPPPPPSSSSSSSSSVTKPERSDKRAENNAPLGDNCAGNHPRDREDIKDEEDRPRPREYPLKCNSANLCAERALSTEKKSRGKQSDISPQSISRNVFVKTKRMIFSPFRRDRDSHRSDVGEEVRGEEDEDDEEEEEEEEGDEEKERRVLRRKSRSKSRSVSPRTPRQDAFHRMQLPLLWPLGFHIKERECNNVAATKASAEEGVTSCRRKSTSNDRKESHRNRTLAETAGSSSSDTRQDNHSFSFDSDSRATSFEATKSDDKKPSKGDDGLSSDLAHKLRILSDAAARRTSVDSQTESPASRIRAESLANTNSSDSSRESRASRLRRTKEDFFMRQDSSPRSSPFDFRMSKIEHPLSSIDREKPKHDVEFRPDITRDATLKNDETAGKVDLPEVSEAAGREDFVESTDASSRPDLIKSASAGMINVDPDTFGRLATSDRGCESLPRPTSKRREVVGPLARIANRLGLARLIRGKDDLEDREDERKMATISTLCRQSLLIDVRPHLEERADAEEQQEEEKLTKEKDESDDPE